jgi:hypothetical protein
MLLNNYSTINFVNNKILLNKKFFIFCRNISDIIEINTSMFSIINRRKHIFKNVLNNVFGFNIKNLILYNIYMIKKSNILD